MSLRKPQMQRIWVIARKDIKEVVRSKSTYLYILPMLAMSTYYFFAFFPLQSALGRQHADAQAVYEAARSFLNSIAYLLPILYCLFASNLTLASLFTEKSKRSLESLMATPVSIRSIWIGKSLSAALTGASVGLGAAVVAYAVIAFGEVLPKLHRAIAPSGLAIASGIVLVPLLLFAVTLLMNYVQLVASSPRVAPLVNGAVLLVVWGGLFFASSYLPLHGISVNYYGLIFLGLIVVLGVMAYVASRALTKERVVLSSKG